MQVKFCKLVGKAKHIFGKNSKSKHFVIKIEQFVHSKYQKLYKKNQHHIQSELYFMKQSCKKIVHSP